MRIWKLACLAILCCFLLVGCTPTQSGDTAKADKAPQAQVEMAVPKQGIPVLMYHMKNIQVMILPQPILSILI